MSQMVRSNSLAREGQVYSLTFMLWTNRVRALGVTIDTELAFVSLKAVSRVASVRILGAGYLDKLGGNLTRSHCSLLAARG